MRNLLERIKLRITRYIKIVLSHFDVAITRNEYFRRMEKSYLNNPARDLELISKLRYVGSASLIRDLINSKSQHSQDLVALSVNQFKENGFFVEFGATNGITISNTYLLEKFYGWKGILAEPARVWHRDLAKNRDALISHKCVWEISNSSLTFIETSVKELSTLEEFQASDLHAEARSSGIKYSVETISLEDLLREMNAPKRIDYLSVDTEGSEYRILESFDFSSYEIGFITVEHNFTSSQDSIYDLLTSKGFTRIFSEHSLGDDWYVPHGHNN